MWAPDCMEGSSDCVNKCQPNFKGLADTAALEVLSNVVPASRCAVLSAVIHDADVNGRTVSTEAGKRKLLSWHEVGSHVRLNSCVCLLAALHEDSFGHHGHALRGNVCATTDDAHKVAYPCNIAVLPNAARPVPIYLH